MESNKYNNFFSLIIAVCSIILILIAMFILSNTFNRRNSTSSEVIAETSSSALSQELSADTQSFSSQSESSQANYSDFNYLDSLKSASSLSSSSASSSSSDSESSSSSNIQNGEVLVRFVGGERNFEIISCNIEDPNLCLPGFSFGYTTPANAQVGDTYLMSGGQIDDRPDFLSLSGFLVTKQ